ncbi:MAG: archaeosortase/exosortase family protein, partial [Sphingopyxis sp.]
MPDGMMPGGEMPNGTMPNGGLPGGATAPDGDAARETPAMAFARGPSPWPRALVALGLCWAALLLLFMRDAAHLVDLWWNSSTFTHCLLILPVLGWLVWLRWPELAR